MVMDNRENASENKFSHDQELQFKVEARLAKLFGLWVAGYIGLEGEHAEAYAKEMVVVQLEEAGNDDIVRKAAADLKAAGRDFSVTALNAEIEQLAAKAREQLISEVKPD